MPQFRYTAYDTNQQTFSGEIAAETVREAVEALESEGYTLLSIEQADAKLPSAMLTGDEASLDRTPPLDTAFEKLFTHSELLIPAFTAYCSELPVGKSRQELEQVIHLLSHNELTRAIASFDSLANVWAPLLSAAAVHDDGELVLAEYFRRTEERHQVRQRRWLFLAYPIFLLLLAMALIVAMSFIVIPTFQAIFQEFGLSLPGPTLLVITVAESIRNGWLLLIVLVLAMLVVLGFFAARTLPHSLREWFSARLLGRGTQLTVTGQLARHVADLHEAGLPLAEAVRQAAGTIRHAAISQTASLLAHQIALGDYMIPRAVGNTLTHSLTHAVSSDMKPRSRIQLLRELSRSYADQTADRLYWTKGIVFGPLAILVVGATVGFTVLALFLPLVRLIEGLSG
ncbi:type II secretion system F family protein [Aeoliella mucimassa]|uniref:Type IV pilin biogenesis protein n=1 Tax=Aeoliella mucimassa TaxID=2527972 RepID=A0A518ANB7_9BACT|nr:type II secretion system F family protein [Aeoliella mucimassa]QDU56214.1 type IV pilin biogenesis protein [Aeoliella mucimassa]